MFDRRRRDGGARYPGAGCIRWHAGEEAAVRNPDTVFIIAECGVNHNGSLEMAIELVEAAVAAGADAAKFQTFRSDALASAFAQKAQYQQVTTDAGEAQLAMLRRLELSEEAHRKLAAHSAARGIEFMSTPFD